MKLISVQNRHEVFELQFVRIWFGFLLAVFIFLLVIGSDSVLGYVGLAILAGSGAFFFRTIRWSVVDEALDCGDSLVFRKGSTTYEVPLSEISVIDHPFENFKGLITVKTRRPIQSRRSFTFRGAPVTSSFNASPVVGELQHRIENPTNG